MDRPKLVDGTQPASWVETSKIIELSEIYMAICISKLRQLLNRKLKEPVEAALKSLLAYLERKSRGNKKTVVMIRFE